MKRFPLGPRESGAASIMSVLVGAGLLFIISLADWSRTFMRAKEVSIKVANANAEIANLTAISYAQAGLQHKVGATPLLTVEGDQFLGAGNDALTVQDGKAIYRQVPLSEVDDAQVAEIFRSGKRPSGTAQETAMEVLETQTVGHTKIYVVKATTVARQGSRSFGPVTTLGRMRITPPETSTTGIVTFTDCTSCLDGAKLLTVPLGYTADISRTRNFGFYKVKSSTNLCDIHFLKNISDKIEDHDGVTSVLKTQIAVYCPCDCPWPK